MKNSRIQKLKALYTSKDKNKKYLTWMVSQTKPHFKLMMSLFGIDATITIFVAATALMNKVLIDNATGESPVFNYWGIILLAVLTIVSMSINALSGILSTYLFEKYSIDVRNKIYSSVLNSKWTEISRFHSGDLVTRLTSDIDNIAKGISTIIPNFFYFIFKLIISFSILCYFDKFIALIMLIVAPLGMLAIIMFGDKLKHYQDLLKKNESKYRSVMQESVENLIIVKAFKKEEKFNNDMQSIRNERLDIILNSNKLNAFIRLTTNIIFSLGYLLSFAWGLYRLSQNDITYGTMSIFITIVAQVKAPILSISSLIPQFINVLSSVGRILEIDNVNKEEPQKTSDISSPLGLKINDISFKYTDEFILKSATINIKPNTTVGIVGGSGAGKTTLAKLMLSLISPNSGDIYLYSDDNCKINISEDTRKFFSYVPQGNTLMSGTIRDNLLLGNNDATDEDIWSALKIAEADFVKNIDGQLDFVLSERGGTISEGQAQRISIARAILHKTPVLILDEATSALDMDCEKKIVSNLKMYKTGLTCIIITHRFSLLEICDEIYEIKNKKFDLR